MKKQLLIILALCATTLAWGTTTVTKTTAQLKDMYGWVSTSLPYNVYQSFNLDGNISVVANSATPGTTASNNVSGIYSSPRWFVYQSDNKGSFTISAANGYVIKSVNFTYSAFGKGILSLKNDAVTATGDQIASGTLVDVNKPSVTFYAGATASDGDRPRIGIETFEVTYEKGIYEDFRDPSTGEQFSYSSADNKSVTTQCFTWTVHQCRFNMKNTMDYLADETTPSHTMWKNNGSYLQTKAVEGGVKTICFPWNQAKADESSKGTETVKVTVDTKNQSQSREGKAADSRGADSQFSFACNVKKNADVKIEIAAGNRITVGPITIVPYLLFTQKTAEVDALEQNSYTYPADKLINNTEDGTVTYSITSNSGATVNAATGEVNLTTVTSAATDTITATWGGVTTTYSLTISYTAPAEGTYWKETFSSLGNKDGYQSYTTGIAGDYGVTWIARNFRHKTSDESDQVNGEYGVRLKYNASSDNKAAYIETSSLEGGVKRLQFKWKTPSNSENPKFTVEFDSKATVYTVDQEQAAADAGTVYDFGYNANIAKNAKFTIRVTDGTCPSIFGPLTIVPYLFYTEKTVEKTYVEGDDNTVDASANLINNLEVGETVTYSLSAGAQATINGSTITLANATEDVTVTATWGAVSTTFTLKVTKAVLPEVEIDENDDLNKYGDLSNSTVTVKNGATVTYNTTGETLSIKKLILTDGATLDIKAGTIAITGSLILEGGYTNGVNYTTPAIHIASGAALTKTQDTVYLTLAMDTTANGAHYYAFSVPFKVEHAKDITYVDPTLAKYGEYGTYRHIKKYDGAGRAEAGEKTGGNWN